MQKKLNYVSFASSKMQIIKMLTLALKETVMCKISSKNIFLRRQRVLCYDTRNPFQQRALESATSAGNIADTEILFI